VRHYVVAMQYGLQPFLKVFIGKDVNKVSVVLGTELLKIYIAISIMFVVGRRGLTPLFDSSPRACFQRLKLKSD